MSILVPFNGSSFIIPTPNEIGWGTNLDNYLVAIANGCLQNIGGNFTLSNDVDFGGTNGIKTVYYKTRSANIAGSGQFRLANAVDSISWRDFGNTTDLPLTVNASNQLTFNGVPLAGAGVLTPNRALISDGSGNVASSSVTTTELGYLAGVTSAIQTQLNSKLNLSGGTLTGDLSFASTKGIIFTDNTVNTVSIAAHNGTTSYSLKWPTAQGTSNQYLTNDGSGNLSWTNAAGTGTVNSGTVNQLAYYASSSNVVSGVPSIFTSGSNQLLVNLGSSAYQFHVKGGNTNNLAIDNAGQQFTELDFLNNGTFKAAIYWDNINSTFTINTTGTILVSNNIRPVTDNSTTNGTASSRWSDLYGVTLHTDSGVTLSTDLDLNAVGYVKNAGGKIAYTQEFTSNGSFITPAGVTFAKVLLIGGGGGGGGGATSATPPGGGGGGGSGFVVEAEVPVTGTITVTLGAGGNGGAAGGNGLPGNDGTDGGSSTFGALLTAAGGTHGSAGLIAANAGGAGGNGFSGGGGGNGGGSSGGPSGTSGGVANNGVAGQNGTSGNGGIGGTGVFGTLPNDVGAFLSMQSANNRRGGGGSGGGGGAGYSTDGNHSNTSTGGQAGSASPGAGTDNTGAGGGGGAGGSVGSSQSGAAGGKGYCRVTYYL